MVSVLVVNDQSLQRLALRMLLEPEPDLSVVGEASSGAEAVRMSATLRPDVVLMGSQPSGADDDITTVRRLARPRHGPRPLQPAEADTHAPRVLVLTHAGHESHAYAALRAGADGFLLITPDLTRTLIDTVREQRTSRTLPGGSGLTTLTGRERDVLTAVASGWSNAEIAERLAIAPTTVKTHVSNILAKIGARARVQAVTFAYESGLVQPAA